MNWRAPLSGLLVAVLAGGCAHDGSSDAPPDEGTPRVQTSGATAGSGTPGKPSAGTPTSTGRVVAVGPDLAVTVPGHWGVLRRPDPWPDVEPYSLCLVPPGSHLHSCAGVNFAWGSVPGPNGAGSYEPHQPGGWYDGTEPAVCPVGESKDNRITWRRDPLTGGARYGAVTDSGRRAVGAHQAAWDRWHASCDDGSTFDPQVWYLPGIEVVIRDLTGHAETAQILASLRFRSDGDVIPDSATHQNAWVSHADGDTVTVRTFHTYYNDAEGKAYARANGLHFPFATDYVDVPTGPPHQVDVSHAVCTGRVSVPMETLTPVIACARYGHSHGVDDAARIPSSLWFEADGTLAQVSELLRS